MALSLGQIGVSFGMTLVIGIFACPDAWPTHLSRKRRRSLAR